MVKKSKFSLQFCKGFTCGELSATDNDQSSRDLQMLNMGFMGDEMKLHDIVIIKLSIHG